MLFPVPMTERPDRALVQARGAPSGVASKIPSWMPMMSPEVVRVILGNRPRDVG
jgi:hypothetical protein